MVLNKLADPAARLYYLCATARFGSSRNVLPNHLKARTYERAVKEKKTTGLWSTALPTRQWHTRRFPVLASQRSWAGSGW